MKLLKSAIRLAEGAKTSVRPQTLDTMDAGTLLPPGQSPNPLRIPRFSRAAPPDDITGLIL